MNHFNAIICAFVTLISVNFHSLCYNLVCDKEYSVIISLFPETINIYDKNFLFFTDGRLCDELRVTDIYMYIVQINFLRKIALYELVDCTSRNLQIFKVQT